MTIEFLESVPFHKNGQHASVSQVLGEFFIRLGLAKEVEV